MDDNKKSTTIWLRPSVISRMDGWLEADNCQSRSEFVDKALRFYMGYLGTENNTTYISQAILTAIQGTLELNNLRLQTILFKCAVELNMLCHTIAAHFRADPIHTRELRAYAVDEVKRTNGRVSFESAVRSQRRIEPEDESRIVLISPYLKGGQNAAKLAHRTRYVATRPGVELLADERSTLPATKKGYSMQMHM